MQRASWAKTRRKFLRAEREHMSFENTLPWISGSKLICWKAHPFYPFHFREMFGNTDIIDFRRITQTSTN